MNFNIVIDISSIVWNVDDYENNKRHYYNMMYGVSDLFEKLKNSNPKILLRNELKDQMIDGFPFSELPDKYYEFGLLIYSFLGNVGGNFISYPNTILPNLISIPNQVKEYYNDTTKKEVKYLLSKIHSDNSDTVFFTFQYLWDENGQLKIKVNEQCIEYQTIVSDKGNGLDTFFDNIMPKFEHNPKHDKKPGNSRNDWLRSDNKDDFESRLSCYNGIDNSVPQRLLDKRYPKLLKNCYYSYDDENKVYVVFRKTEENIYHGHDEYNIQEIPIEVKNHFKPQKDR